MERALDARGNPQSAVSFVHIAGTNGKGSVAAMLESIYRAAGYRTGQLCSPHLQRYVERVQIAGRPMTEREAVRALFDQRDDARLSDLTFFEHTTLLALESFARAECDIVFLETGLGGRLDATNVVTPELSVITHIGLDHTRVLGRTYAAIAAEKAGIIKRGVPVVVGTRDRRAQKAIEARAEDLVAPTWWIGQDFDAQWQGDSLDVEVESQTYRGLRVGLLGRHQRDNAACAVAAAHVLRQRGLDWRASDLARGLSRVRWPGRLEWHDARPAFLFDAAHNPAGCAALADFLREHDHKGPVVLLFGAMKDKDHRAMLRALAGEVDHIVYAAPNMERAASPTSLSRVRKGQVATSVRQGVAAARKMAGRSGLVVVAGSIFLVAEARAIVKGVRTDPPIGL